MRFFDCNTYIGLPSKAPIGGPVAPGVSAEELLSAMDRAGIERAVVWHIAQREQSPQIGNALLAELIGPHDRLVGCWTLLPHHAGELGDLDEWFSRAGAAGIRAFRVFPQEHRYCLRAEVLGQMLDRMEAARAPLILSPPKNDWKDVYDLLAAKPKLTAILTCPDCWGADRFFRPLIERYTNVYVEISQYILDGGIESFVNDYGPERILFGSGFPACYHGGMMLAVAHAEISDEDRQAIAVGNLERLLKEVKL